MKKLIALEKAFCEMDENISQGMDYPDAEHKAALYAVKMTSQQNRGKWDYLSACAALENRYAEKYR